MKMASNLPTVTSDTSFPTPTKVTGYTNKLYETMRRSNVEAVKGVMKDTEESIGSNVFRYELRRTYILHTTVWSGNDQVLEALLENATCALLVNEIDCWGRTPLMIAASQGNVDSVYTLLKYNADCRYIDPVRGHTVLHKAALAGQDTVLEILLEKGATEILETKDNQGRTALMAAVDRGYLKCIKVLEKAGAKFDVRCNKRQTIIHVASAKGNVKVLEELLVHPQIVSMHMRCSALTSKDVDGYSSLMLAVMAGSAPCVRLLLKHGVHKYEMYEEFKYNPLYHAAKKGYSDIVQLLLMSDECRQLVFSPDADTQRTIELARNGQIFLEDLIIVHGIHGCYMIESILQDTNNDPRYSKKLQEYKKYISMYKYTCLHLAAQSGDVKTLEIFYCCYMVIENGRVKICCEDINKRNALNQTPLHLAALSGSAECAKFLIKNGANLAAKLMPKAYFTDTSVSTAVEYVLKHVPQGEEILAEVMDESIMVRGPILGQENILLDFNVLCPKGENRLTVLQEMYKHRDRRMYPLLKHPLVQALIYIEWHKMRYSFPITLHFLVYVTYISTLAAYLLIDFEEKVDSFFYAILLFQCLLALIVSSPFLLLGGGSKTDKLFRFMTKICPPILTFVALIIDNKPLSSFALIFSWLALIHFTNISSVICYKFATFQYIMKKLVDHIIVFVYILTGFSFTFYLLYREDNSGTFRTLWQSVLSTTVILLQGDLSTTPLMKEPEETTVPYDMLIAGGMMQQLFVVIVVLALLNMWVGLAVRGGRELERQGHIHYHRNQVRVLVVLEEIFGILFSIFTKRKVEENDIVVVSEGDIPRDLHSALRCYANERRKGKTNLLEISRTLETLLNKVDNMEKKIEDLRTTKFHVVQRIEKKLFSDYDKK